MRILLLIVCFCLSGCGDRAPGEPSLSGYTDGETYIRIFKAESELELWQRGATDDTYSLKKTYPICAWSGRLGPKLKEGDGQSPEGFYWVAKGSLNPNSSYHLAFNLGFPNEYDRTHGRTGSFLMVHGSCVSVGCYAMTNGGIEEIYRSVEHSLNAGQAGVRVHVFPFRMTAENMRVHTDHKWHRFWVNLKGGYDWFERTGRPPNVGVENQTYVFNDT